MQPVHEIEVWDPLARLLHGSLVATFAVAGDEASRLHVRAGYGALGLAALRVPWGLTGTRHAPVCTMFMGRRRT